MFAKLLKHEFRNSRSILGLLTVICLGVAVVAAIAMKLILVSESSGTYTDGSAILLLIAFPLLAMAFLAIIAYGVTSIILLYVQFFKNKFTDEGYLTFTLPTNVHQIYLSSLVNMLIWQVITILTVVVSIGIFVLFGTSPDQLINTDLFRVDTSEFVLTFEMLGNELGWTSLNTVQMILQYAVSVVSGLVLATTCITIGATIAKKHKALAAIGIYYGASYVVSGITTVVSMSVGAMGNDFGGVMSGMSIVTIILHLGIIVGGYFLTTHMMKNKLNLP